MSWNKGWYEPQGSLVLKVHLSGITLCFTAAVHLWWGAKERGIKSVMCCSYVYVVRFGFLWWFFFFLIQLLFCACGGVFWLCKTTLQYLTDETVFCAEDEPEACLLGLEPHSAVSKGLKGFPLLWSSRQLSHRWVCCEQKQVLEDIHNSWHESGKVPCTFEVLEAGMCVVCQVSGKGVSTL